MNRIFALLTIVLCIISVNQTADANSKMNLQLVVEVTGRYSGKPMSGVEVRVIDVFGYSTYVHKLKKFTNQHGKATFNAKEFSGFDMKRGQSWNPNQYTPKLGGANRLKLRIEVEDKIRHFEITSEKLYTLSIEI